MILWAVLILIIIVILVLGYLGFVPGLSHLFGSDKARDLGVYASTESFNSASQKIMLQAIPSSAGGGLGLGSYVVPSDPHPIDIMLTSEEMTSLVQKEFFKVNPIAQDLQIKIHGDGTVEASGILNFYRLAQVIPDARLNEVIQYAKKYQIFGSTAPFYIAGRGSMINNQASLNISEVQIGRVNVPVKTDMNQAADSIINRNIRNISGLSVTSASFNQGQLHLVGQFPNLSELLK